MNAPAPFPTVLGDGAMTFDQFLAWEPEEHLPLGEWELMGGFLVHAILEDDPHIYTRSGLIRELVRHLPPGRPCKPMPNGKAVKISERDGYIPDMSIHCDGEPRVIFEVSASTRAFDMTVKWRFYFQNPTIDMVMVLDVLERRVLVWRRGYETAAILTSGVVCCPLPDGEIALEIERFWDYL